MTEVHCCVHFCVSSQYLNSGPHACGKCPELFPRPFHLQRECRHHSIPGSSPCVLRLMGNAVWGSLLAGVCSCLVSEETCSLQRLLFSCSFLLPEAFVMCPLRASTVLCIGVLSQEQNFPFSLVQRHCGLGCFSSLEDGLLASAMHGVGEELPSGFHKGSNVLLPMQGGGVA